MDMENYFFYYMFKRYYIQSFFAKQRYVLKIHFFKKTLYNQIMITFKKGFQQFH